LIDLCVAQLRVRSSAPGRNSQSPSDITTLLQFGIGLYVAATSTLPTTVVD
jgi:hypothetical protein